VTDLGSSCCPKCQSSDITYRKKRNEYICEDCDAVFRSESAFTPLNVFLSYGHDEYSSFANRLKEDLQARGHNVWYDQDRLRAGCDWELYIEEGFDWVTREPDRGRMVLLMTPHSLRRPDGYCRNEVARALSRRVRIVPVMVAWVEPLLSIAQLQWLDMRDCFPVEEKRERYASKLERLLLALEQEQLDFGGARSRLEQILEPISFEAEANEHLLRFTGRKWVLDVINGWLANHDASRVFWITGGPGSGKTALASWLCYQLRDIKAFHFCMNGHTEKSDPKRCVLSIAFQLASLIPAYMSRLGMINLERLVKESNAKTLFDLLIVQSLIESCPSQDENIVILIDALDEATDGDGNELASFIASQFIKTPKWLRLIITSRPEPLLQHMLQSFDPFIIDTSSRENVSDLHEFLERELSKSARSSSVSPQAMETILQRSEGVFLYAEWVRQELESGRLTLDRVGEFPQGLGGIYVQYFARQFPDVGRFRAEARPALGLVLAAQNPLEVGILSGALGWNDEYKVKDVVESMGTLFRIVDGRVEPFHKSVRDWLSDPAKAGRYFVSPKDGHKALAAIGWDAYLRFKTVRESIRPAGAAALSPAETRCLEELPYHLLKCGEECDKEKLRTFITDIDAFVVLYWKNMYQLLGCWDAVDDKAWFVRTCAARLGEFEKRSADVGRTGRAFHTVGLFLYYLEMFGDAEPFLEKAVRYYAGTPDELMSATAMNDLGECHVRNDKYDDAEPVYQRALDIRRRLLTNFHEDTADSINNHGHVFYYRQQYDQAERLYREALDIRQALFPANHPKVAEGCNNLGVVASAKGDKVQARSLYRRAVEIMEACGLDETWEAALYYNHLGGAAQDEGDLDAAEAAYAKTLDVRCKIFGWHQQSTLPSLFRLAKVHALQGKQERVMSLLSRIPPELATQNLRPEIMFSEVIGVANGFLEKGHQAQADAFLEEAERIFTRIFRTETPALLQLLAETASYFEKQGRYDLAAGKYEKTLDVVAKIHGLRHPGTLSVMHAFARILRLQGDRDKAFDLYSKLIRIGESILAEAAVEGGHDRGNISKWTAIGFNEIAFHKHVPGGDWRSAEAGYRRAVELMAGAGEPVELANLELNLQTVLHRSVQGANLEKVKELTLFLEGKGDPRAGKGRAILGAAQNPPG